MNVNGKTKVYGIIGNPVEHSLSPAMHNAAFAALGENRVYIPLPSPDIEVAVAGVRALGIQGASVTIPHKESVMDHLDRIDPLAQKIGAVNTIEVVETADKTELIGSNTDWLGANRALARKIELRESSAVILGAGGSARAIGFGLLQEGCHVEIHSRTESRGRALADDLGCSWKSLTEQDTKSYDILINATSVGMGSQKDVLPISAEALSQFTVVMDIVYAPLQTRLLQEAAYHGAHCINGLEMLLYQGVAQFECWTKREPPVEVMRQALITQLQQKRN
ncbi:MAG: shikimate dehydrogenase [Desulfobulbaceae bacterium]|nr:MAG: shikimate dehydrogenase [Desulfobulbaceae bacterium]